MSDTTVQTLAGFLLDRIAEDETVAQAAGLTAPMRWQLRTTLSAIVNGELIGPRGTVEADPDRVLAESKAKRRIVEKCEAAVRDDDWDDDNVPTFADETLRLLAAPYASHPGYRDEWAPEGQR